MFEELSNRFETIFKKVRGQGVLREENIAVAMREVKRALLEADVNFRVVKDFVSRVQEKALGKEVVGSVTPGQQFVKIVHDELTELMGGEITPLTFHTNRLNIILVAGLQGSGKTTACAKLALHFRKNGHRPLMVACDIHRPAAIDQLETLGKSLGVETYSERHSTDAASICMAGIHHARQQDATLVCIDTAGRLHIDASMMDELKQVRQTAKPDEIFFVADAMTGQDAVNVATEFHTAIGFTGVLLSKMDGDARGGAALSILKVTNVPVRFIGTSEKPDGLEIFHPERMASRILGMGDIVSLVEKAQETVDSEKSARLERKIRKNLFSLQDFLEQLRQIKKMGSLEDILSMIPGMGNQINTAQIDSDSLARTEAIICSMTLSEREKPVIIDGSRRRRIARGSGTSVQDVNKLLKQYDTMKTMIKRMNKVSGKRGQAAALRNIFAG